MFRCPLSVVLSTLIAVTLRVGASRASDDQPTVKGKTATQWQEVLQNDAKVERRQAALIALAVLGPKVRGVVPAVCTGLKDADSTVRRSAAETLGQMGSEAKSAVNPLVEILKTEKEPAVRQAAATALGRFGPAAKSALDDLSDALKDKHAGTRRAAAEALGRIGPDAWTSVAQLIPLLKDPDRLVRARTAFALGRIHSQGAATSLGEALTKDTYAPVRRAAAEALAELGPKAQAALAALGQALKDTQPEVRRAAALALTKVGPEAKQSLPALTGALQDSDKFVRTLAIQAIGSLGKDAQTSVSALARCLMDNSVEVRLAAVEELGHLGPVAKAALPTLQEVQKNDRRAAVREAAAEAVKKITAPP